MPSLAQALGTLDLLVNGALPWGLLTTTQASPYLNSLSSEPGRHSMGNLKFPHQGSIPGFLLAKSRIHTKISLADIEMFWIKEVKSTRNMGYQLEQVA
jgi:hypothetical protein